MDVNAPSSKPSEHLLRTLMEFVISCLVLWLFRVWCLESHMVKDGLRIVIPNNSGPKEVGVSFSLTRRDRCTLQGLLHSLLRDPGTFHL